MLRIYPVVMAAAFLAGCNSPAAVSNGIVRHWDELSEADWELEQEKGQNSYYGVPVLENKLIAHGQAGETEAMKLVRNFDHRIRCSGLTVIIGIKGRDRAKDVLVQHLTDPYEPIRWRCWHELRDLGVVSIDSMPARQECLSQWKHLKLELLEDMGRHVTAE